MSETAASAAPATADDALAAAKAAYDKAVADKAAYDKAHPPEIDPAHAFHCDRCGYEGHGRCACPALEAAEGTA